MRKTRSRGVAVLAGLLAAWVGGPANVPAADPVAPPAAAATKRPARPAPPTRDPNAPGFVPKKELPDGAVPPADADGNFVVGPTHKKAPEMAAQEGVPKGTVFDLVMKSSDSKIYPGIAREAGTFGT